MKWFRKRAVTACGLDVEGMSRDVRHFVARMKRMKRQPRECAHVNMSELDLSRLQVRFTYVSEREHSYVIVLIMNGIHHDTSDKDLTAITDYLKLAVIPYVDLRCKGIAVTRELKC